MQIIRFPDWADADALLARPSGDLSAFREKVAPLLASVRRDGDVALRRLAEQFDGIFPTPLEAEAVEFEASALILPEDLKSAIRQAYANIRAYHAAQREAKRPVETMPGVLCWRESVPIERIGLYVPGGTAPLFSTVLMLGVPAQLAGCSEIVLCTPPGADGSVHPAILFAAGLCGIRRVFKLGGVQAIGAMAYGTATVPRVWKIFGPGNSWVTAAKQLVSLDGVAIDLPAGPSELAIVADAAANPAFVAADLLSQAEHGADSQVLLLSDDERLIFSVKKALEQQLTNLPRRDFAAAALQNSRALLVPNLESALQWVNAYAPEHLILHVENPSIWAQQVINAGSVFLGGFTPESAGDYASGTNHTLPTGGYARMTAGVSLDSFFKKITFQSISPAGLRALATTITTMARAEGLEAHARAVDLRLAGVVADSNRRETHMLERLVRPDIRELKPYSSARDEAPASPPGPLSKGEGVVSAWFSGKTKRTRSPSPLERGPGGEAIFLDANENSLGGPLEEDFSRYPDPQQPDLKQALALEQGISPAQIFLGNGSDEAIDLLLRAFCEPGRDNIILLPPTYGMYAVQAGIHGVEIRRVPLKPDFTPDAAAVLAAADEGSKLLFLCSPNNPTGNCLPDEFVLEMLTRFPGLVVVDEAYADFSGRPSATRWLADFPNLVILQTFSKAWGLAGLRVGMAYADAFVIDVLNKIKYPYNLNTLTPRLALQALVRAPLVREKVTRLLIERTRLASALAAIPGIVKVWPSDANFLLVQTVDADGLYQFLCDNGIVVRNRSREMHCAGCLRITVGTPAENDRLLECLRHAALG